jgi:hypothetical protein
VSYLTSSIFLSAHELCIKLLNFYLILTILLLVYGRYEIMCNILELKLCLNKYESIDKLLHSKSDPYLTGPD